MRVAFAGGRVVAHIAGERSARPSEYGQDRCPARAFGADRSPQEDHHNRRVTHDAADPERHSAGDTRSDRRQQDLSDRGRLGLSQRIGSLPHVRWNLQQRLTRRGHDQRQRDQGHHRPGCEKGLAIDRPAGRDL